MALRLPKQSAADTGEKSRRNSGAISRLFEPEGAVFRKGRCEGYLFSGYLDVWVSYAFLTEKPSTPQWG
jgi:hypothetical protein